MKLEIQAKYVFQKVISSGVCVIYMNQCKSMVLTNLLLFLSRAITFGSVWCSGPSSSIAKTGNSLFLYLFL